MSQTIRCFTLFDITNTGVRQRNKIPEGVDIKKYIYERNTQSNFDTILQVISLRSQPEIISNPNIVEYNLNECDYFGFIYVGEAVKVWYFDFTVYHSSVFANDRQEFGNLYNDCEGIPMVKCKYEHQDLSNFLNTNIETKNIHFKLL